MSDLRDIIPSEFYRGDEESPYAKNVGELIEQLQRLPPKLPIEQGFYRGCRLTVFNVKMKTAHLVIVESEE